MSHICQVHPSFKIKRDKLWFNPSYSANLKIKVGKIFIRLVDKHFPRHHKYYKLFSRNSIKLSYSWKMSSGSILRLWKIQNHLPPKRAIANEKQTVLWMVTVFLNTLFTKHLLAQLLINIAMILMKILSKNITITINALSEVNFVERILNYSSIYRNWKRERYQLFY